MYLEKPMGTEKCRMHTAAQASCHHQDPRQAASGATCPTPRATSKQAGLEAMDEEKAW